MTLIDHNLRTLAPALVEEFIQVSWSSTRSGAGADTIEFVLNIEVQSAERGMIEAWIESAQGRRTVLHRQPIRITTHLDPFMLHVDAVRQNGSDDCSIAAISMLMEAPSGLAGRERPLYAQTSLLAEAGFPAGRYNPPTLRRIARPLSVASA